MAPDTGDVDLHAAPGLGTSQSYTNAWAAWVREMVGDAIIANDRESDRMSGVDHLDAATSATIISHSADDATHELNKQPGMSGTWKPSQDTSAAMAMINKDSRATERSQLSEQDDLTGLLRSSLPRK